MSVALDTYVFIKYQQEWVADKSPVRVCEKSRRIGITWATAAGCVLDAAEGLMDAWYSAYNQDQAAEFIRDCAKWAKEFDYACSDVEDVILKDGERDILATRITFGSGKRITALSSKPSNFRGKQGHIILDEFAFHQDAKELVKAALAMLMWGGRLSIISTHNGQDSEFNDLVGRAESMGYSHHKITIYDALDQGLYERIALIQKSKGVEVAPKDEWVEELFQFYGDDSDEELLCIPAQSGGVYIPRVITEPAQSEQYKVVQWFADKKMVLKSEAEQIDLTNNWLSVEVWPRIRDMKLKGIPMFAGFDFGRSSDLSVLSLGYERNNHLHVPLILEMGNVPHDRQKQVIFALFTGLRILRASFDATGSGEAVAESTMIRFGEEIVECYKITEVWYNLNLPVLKSRFESKGITIPKNPDIPKDLAMFRKVNGIPKLPNIRANARKPEGGKKLTRHGDSGISLAMLSNAAEKVDSSPFAYQAVKKRVGQFAIEGGCL